MPPKVQHPIITALAALFFIYFTAGFFGYGIDSDTYYMIKSGQKLLTTLKYHPSRFQGSLVPELVIGATSLVGGFFLSNLVSVFLGTASLLLFFLLLRKAFDAASAILIVLTVGLNPHFVECASTSADDIYSLFFILSGITALYRRKYFIIASLMFALALSSRIADALIVGGIYLYFLAASWKDRTVFSRFFLSGCIGLVLSAILYIPAFVVSGYSFRCFTYGIGTMSFFGHLSRFVYKNVYLWGLLPSLFLLLSTVYILVRNKKMGFFRQPIIVGGLVILALHEYLFFKVPTRIAILLPILFLIVPIWAALGNSKKLLKVLLVLTISYNAVNIDVLDIKYNMPERAKATEAVAADIGLFVRRGMLIDNLIMRKERQDLFLPPENKPSRK